MLFYFIILVSENSHRLTIIQRTSGTRSFYSRAGAVWEGGDVGVMSERPDNRQTTVGITLSAEVSNVDEKQTNLKQITLFLSFLFKRTMEI